MSKSDASAHPVRYRIWLPRGDGLGVYNETTNEFDDTPRMVLPGEQVDNVTVHGDVAALPDGRVGMAIGSDKLEIIPDAVVMLSTGLNDNKGVEIFEGDIFLVEWKKSEIPVVIEYRSDACAFVYENEDCRVGGTFVEDLPTSHITVIGNIYQNPGLTK